MPSPEPFVVSLGPDISLSSETLERAARADARRVRPTDAATEALRRARTAPRPDPDPGPALAAQARPPDNADNPTDRHVRALP